MKRFKQILSLIFAVIMLLTAVPMQSITAVDEKSIEISAVEFADDMPISMKYVEFIKDDQDCGNIVPMGVYGAMDYELDITFSDGDKVLLSEIFEKDEISSLSGPNIFVNYDECYNAILNDEETVNVYVELKMRANEKDLTYECTLQKKIVPGIIKSMEPITILPSVIYGCDITHNSYWIPDLYDVYEKHLFKAEFYDGTEAFVECGKEKDKVNLDFEHGGDVYEVSSWVTFTFYDEIIFKKVELVERYKEVELVDCKFVDGKPEEISFKLYRTDGAVESYTETVDINRMGYTDLNRIYGYDVGIYYGNSGSSFKTDDKLYVEFYIGKITDKLFFAPEDVCSCKICHYKGIKFIYFSIISLFWKLLNINQYCDCGMEHW